MPFKAIDMRWYRLQDNSNLIGHEIFVARKSEFLNKWLTDFHGLVLDMEDIRKIKDNFTHFFRVIDPEG